MKAATVRTLLLIISGIQLLFAIGFAFQVPALTSLWPFPGTTPMTITLLASFLAAAAASTFWAVLPRNYGALAGIALDYLVIFAPITAYLLWSGISQGNQTYTAAAVVCGAAALFGLWLLLWARKIPFDNPLPIPAPVRWSFMIFAVALLLVGTLLVLRVPNVIPWSITPELSVIIGFMFFGAMVYFIYGLMRPSWANASSQLAGFLAYDLVLILPFLSRLPTLAPEFRVGQWLYLAVVIYSGLVAIYYLFVHPQTRVRGAQAAPALG